MHTISPYSITAQSDIDNSIVEHITGNIVNFFYSVVVTVPPYTSLGVI